MRLKEALKNLKVAFGQDVIKNLKFEYNITINTGQELDKQPVFTLSTYIQTVEALSVILPKSTFQYQEPPACRCRSSKHGRSSKQIKKDHKRNKRR